MRFITVFLSLALFLAPAAPARSQTVLDAMAEEARAEIDAMHRALQFDFGDHEGERSLASGFRRAGIGQSRQFLIYWHAGLQASTVLDAHGVYLSARRDLDTLVKAVAAGDVRPGAAEQAILRGMAHLRAIDRILRRWLDAEIAKLVEQARWLDAAKAAACCFGKPESPRGVFEALANRAAGRVVGGNYRAVGGTHVFPRPKEIAKGGGVLDPDALDDLLAEAVRTGDPQALKRAVADVGFRLLTRDAPDLVEARRILALLEERLGYAGEPVADLLRRIETMPPGPERDLLLDEASRALQDRIGHLAELLALSGTDAETRDRSVGTLIADGKRLSQLFDDIVEPGGDASGSSRMLSGLLAATKAYDLANSDDPRATDLVSALYDVGDALPTSPFAPIAAPMGAVAAQLDRTAIAWDLAAEALGGVVDEIGGDPTGVARSRAAAEKLQKVLDPRAFVADMTDSFTSGVMSNVPFMRSLYDWATS